MEVFFKKSFIKDLRGLPLKTRAKVEKFSFEHSAKVSDIYDLGAIVKISGHADYYRKRFGDYRVGFRISGDRIVFYRALHRREIYRYFP